MFDLNSGIVLDSGNYVVNFDHLREEDYEKVFEHETVLVLDNKNAHISTDSFVNSVIRHIVIDERFKDIQVSFFKDTRDKRRATPKQVRFIGAILENNYGYVLKNNQRKFLERQSRCIIQRIIDTFKGTEFIYWLPGQATVKNNKVYF